MNGYLMPYRDKMWFMAGIDSLAHPSAARLEVVQINKSMWRPVIGWHLNPGVEPMTGLEVAILFIEGVHTPKILVPEQGIPSIGTKEIAQPYCSARTTKYVFSGHSLWPSPLGVMALLLTTDGTSLTSGEQVTLNGAFIRPICGAQPGFLFGL